DSGAGTSHAGSGTGGDTKGEVSESPIPPDPVNVDYAKKATDMVLDYLEETRDTPDQDLLDQLNWSEDDLERFADRWQKVRKMQNDPIPGKNQDIEDALKSLGLRTPSGQANQIRESSDSLEGIRDSGNRQPPPAAYRDAFDAFRRAMGRGK
ncbi:circumsporozoite protein-membrane associated protein, partial [Rubripirellula sp.]|nr:circumsporozoite protein-membrane associated protein [Rubripirellula sp.]